MKGRKFEDFAKTSIQKEKRISYCRNDETETHYRSLSRDRRERKVLKSQELQLNETTADRTIFGVFRSHAPFIIESSICRSPFLFISLTFFVTNETGAISILSVYEPLLPVCRNLSIVSFSATLLFHSLPSLSMLFLSDSFYPILALLSLDFSLLTFLSQPFLLSQLACISMEIH